MGTLALFFRNLAKCGKDVLLEDRNEVIVNGKPREVFTALPLGPHYTSSGAGDTNNDRAVVKTLRGVTVFDGTNTETVATHRLCLPWRDDVGAEQWVTLKGKRLRIITAENCCEADERLILMCTERGEDSKVVNRG